MKTLSILLLASALPLFAGIIPVPNGDFEDNGKSWTIDENSVISAFSTEQAHSGKYSLKIDDQSKTVGSGVSSEMMDVPPDSMLKISCWYYAVEGSGCGLYLQQFDKNGKDIKTGDSSHIAGLGGYNKTWTSFSRQIPLENGTEKVRIYIHSYMRELVTIYLDDFQLETVPLRMEPPWKGQYKLKPTDRLTAADVVGPDGIVYPNWKHCGVEGGIPSVADGLNIRDFGGIADDGQDDQPALQAACNAAAKTGKAVILNKGIYILKSPVLIHEDGVVIRGQGMGKTILKFTYALPENGIRFTWPEKGATLKTGAVIEVHTIPYGLRSIVIEANGKKVHTWNSGIHSGNTFSTRCAQRVVAAAVPEGGPVTLKATATYNDGKTLSTEVACTLSTDKADHETVNNQWNRWSAAINFLGNSHPDTKRKLTKDALRGDTVIMLEHAEDLKAGDCLVIDAPGTKRWKELVECACRWGSYRRYAVRITAVDGNRVTLEQPLRIDFPIIDGSYVWLIKPIQHGGVENFTIEQTEDLWISTVFFTYAWNCWGKQVEVIKCGRFPIYGQQAKFCEIRDCVFRDAWFKGGGGTAYTGWEHSWDCLIDGIETFEYRHAPLFQWSASGCVIRNGLFHNSDGQWHSGWTNENLMENCVIESVHDHGAYGYGLWASPPEDAAHGPNGPRNVVYNCDITSPRDGLWMGGMNECWLILHNRFNVKKGVGVYAKTSSFDHIIKGNVFILHQPGASGIRLLTPDCINITFADNTVYGAALASGSDRVKLDASNNRLLPLAEASNAQRPQPACPSIFEWQRKH